MNNVGPKEETRVHYTTALHSQQPIVRRKHPDPTGGLCGLHNSPLSQPNQLRTDLNGNWDGDGRYHPLTLDQAGFPDTSGVTRPHLSRTLGRTWKDCHHSSELRADEPLFCEEEAEVIVHEVTTTDSLAGVSLKYGITLTDLRRANHLWASDSIHLRKVLYIPLDRSSRARDLVRDMEVNTTPLVDLSALQGPAATTESSPSGFSILRVPTSRMSFFPPPATSGKAPSVSSVSPPVSGSNVKTPSHVRHSISPSLVSILTALPISASTRDDLIARLSFDSASSNVSERSRTSLDHSEGHELDVVINREQMASSKITHRPKFMSKAADTHMIQSLIRNKHSAYPTEPRNTQARHLSTTPSTIYTPKIQDNTSIRTVQMEPSPIMQLPTLRSQLPPVNGIYTQHRSQDGLIELD